MKDKRFDGITISLDDVSPDMLNIICLTAEKEYSVALQMVEEYISKAEDAKHGNIAAMISLQILALAGYEEIASVLLKALLKNFKASSKARNICQRTIQLL